MRDVPCREAAAVRDVEAVQVLLVTSAPSPAAPWEDAPGAAFELSLASTIAAAAARLAAWPADVVVLDAALAQAEASELPRLCQELGSASVLVRSDDFTPAVALLLNRLGGAAAFLPAVPRAAQAPFVRLAAERARLAAALADRDAQLEERTQELERSSARFRDVIERNADAIVVVDQEGVIRFANAVAIELFRSPREELLGTSFGFPVVAGETTELDLLHTDRPRVVEMRVVESEWEGKVACIASLRDITARKRAEEDTRRLIREHAARNAAEASARRFRFLAEAGTLLSAPLDYTATLATLARLCTTKFADWTVIYLLDEQGSVQRLEIAHRDPAKAEAAQGLHEHPIAADGPHPVRVVLRTRSPLLVTHVDDERLTTIAQDENHRALLRELGFASFMVVPLVARGRELGAIALISADPDRAFTEEDLAVANDLALRAALAVDNARLYEEANAANRAKSDLLAVIAHDLRTPLNSIIGHADLLALGIPERLSEQGLQHVERIRMSATHLVYLIDQLLSFARLEAGREELRLQDVDANTLAREVAAVLESLARERSLLFQLDLPSRDLPLRTDPDRLRQVLLNLVGNAIKYTERGEVLLEVRASADGTRIFHVRDTGIGIRPEHIDQIFEPFWQVQSDRRSSRDGTGLGLSVVRRLTRLLGGEVEVESVVGSGSTFTVRLPQQPAE